MLLFFIYILSLRVIILILILYTLYYIIYRLRVYKKNIDEGEIRTRALDGIEPESIALDRSATSSNFIIVLFINKLFILKINF